MKTDLKNLSKSELNKVLQTTKAEIERRENIVNAAQKIAKIMENHDITIRDIINLEMFTTKRRKQQPVKTANKKKTNQNKRSDNRSFVKPKYTSADGKYTWSGRGKAPAWVLEFCAENHIDLAKFKQQKTVD